MVVAEYEQPQLGNALSDAYHKGHENFYENQRTETELEEALNHVEEMLPVLEALDFAPPRPVTIVSNNQLQRLREVTGRTDLQMGDTSAVGFSLRHPESPDERGPRGTPASSGPPGGQPSGGGEPLPVPRADPPRAGQRMTMKGDPYPAPGLTSENRPGRSRTTRRRKISRYLSE